MKQEQSQKEQSQKEEAPKEKASKEPGKKPNRAKKGQATGTRSVRATGSRKETAVAEETTPDIADDAQPLTPAAELKTDESNTHEVSDGGGDEMAAESGVGELYEGAAQPGESPAAITACNKYLAMGQTRSVRGLAQAFKEQPQNAVPTQSYETMRRWSEKFNWPQRAIEYDQRARREALALRQEVFCSGHAPEVTRVERLCEVSQVIEDQILEQGLPVEGKVTARCPRCQHTVQIGTGELVEPYRNLWLTTTKVRAEGETTTTRQFNSPLVSAYRGVLSDIAKETGGRRHDLAQKVLSRLNFSLLPRDFVRRIGSGDNPEDVLVDLIETFYSDDPTVHFQRGLKR